MNFDLIKVPSLGELWTEWLNVASVFMASWSLFRGFGLAEPLEEEQYNPNRPEITLL